MNKLIRNMILATALALPAAACHNSSRFSGDHMSPGMMKKVLLDIHLAEAYSITLKDSLHRAGTKNTDSLAVFYNDIFNHYHITQEQFTQSLNWYKDHPEDLDTIYNNMIPQVVGMQAAAGKKN